MADAALVIAGALERNRKLWAEASAKIALAIEGIDPLAALPALLMVVATVHADAGDFPSKELIHKTLDGFFEAEKNFRARGGK